MSPSKKHCIGVFNNNINIIIKP